MINVELSRNGCVATAGPAKAGREIQNERVSGMESKPRRVASSRQRDIRT
jgi:hypothetical protein